LANFFKILETRKVRILEQWFLEYTEEEIYRCYASQCNSIGNAGLIATQ